MPDLLSICICTRNREEDLKKCIASLSSQRNITQYNIELLIIDDGQLGKDLLEAFEKACSHYHFSYYKKEEPGLFLSRLKAIELAQGEVILFLDDDVVLDENYLMTLFSTYQQHPDIVGVGGVDSRLPNYSFFRWLYTTLFFYHSNHPGKLSISMMNSAMYRWKKAKQPFSTEYMDGCNMSFKKEVLKNVQFQNYFRHYSLGEDIYLSLIASKSGNLLINPNLKVEHYQTTASRDSVEKVAFMKIVNHYKLLPYSQRSKIKYLLIYWSFFGMMLASLLKRDFAELKGYLKGLKSL